MNRYGNLNTVTMVNNELHALRNAVPKNNNLVGGGNYVVPLFNRGTAAEGVVIGRHLGKAKPFFGGVFEKRLVKLL